MMHKRIAVNHPYFFPYAGYFRLMAHADIMVLFDCVQFPRRGYVHRNQLPNHQGKLDWFSLNLKKQKRGVLIKDIEFVDNINQEIHKNIKKFPSLKNHSYSHSHLNFLEQLKELNTTTKPCDYLCDSLEKINNIMDFGCQLIRSSSLNLDSSTKGENRVLAILEILGATEYINAPGGRKLYNKQRFEERSIDLKFLRPYRHNSLQKQSSLLHRLYTEDIDAIRQDIMEQIQWQI